MGLEYHPLFHLTRVFSIFMFIYIRYMIAIEKEWVNPIFAEEYAKKGNGGSLPNA